MPDTPAKHQLAGAPAPVYIELPHQEFTRGHACPIIT